VSRIWRVLFWLLVAASLLANAVVLGLALRMGEMRELANGGSTGFTDLPRQTRAEVRGALRDNRAALAGPLTALGAARRAMFEAAAARPFDRAALEAAMARVRQATGEMQAAAHAVMLEAYARAAAER
jgi:uncharacterized membrane protein